ncbi:hypothetical protein N7452_008381 [Penicillium brevicompactum]|uniref:Uncharacterized protein n=1 Tax=Penicillium brevicompactum TaxID=5074 RepID=A0A9W9Q6L7_PENBR|nr:hypothetical protein N7452_008381 [Penicillium brevicompactum]
MFPYILRHVRRTFFDPLATSKARVREILVELPVGSAHPWNPERLLLCRTEDGIIEIDLSPFSEEFFDDPVDLGEMGEILWRRMAGFQPQLGVFNDFQILQAPAPTFKVPIKTDQITILAVYRKSPSYFDLCLADAEYNTSCWSEKEIFAGITHSGDIFKGEDILQYVKFDTDTHTEKEICVLISSFNYTPITKFLGTHPALLVADHVEKVMILWVIPVPLDAATIGDATICCPLVIKRDGESLICSILPVATTDRGKECYGARLKSDAFPEAIRRADFTVSATLVDNENGTTPAPGFEQKVGSSSPEVQRTMIPDNAVFTTDTTTLPPFLNSKHTQIIRFKTGIEFILPDGEHALDSQTPGLVLPCIFGSRLEGPFLLATGTTPTNVPFANEASILDYYKQLKSAVVVVNDRMTDKSRSLAAAYRINALFIVQLTLRNEPKNNDEILSALNSTNINAVTALAGPQSLVVVQIFQKFYFYRGIANSKFINTAQTAFGTDVTSILESVSMDSILDPRIPRIISLGDSERILLPKSGQWIQPQDLKKMFEDIMAQQIHCLEEDILSAITQLQVLLNQKDLRDLSRSLVAALTTNVSNLVTPLRNAYGKFLREEYDIESPESGKKKAVLLDELTKATQEMQIALKPVIPVLAEMLSLQKTSKRTHDLQRLFRQCQIQSNVEAAKAMTFGTLAEYLGTYAENMGVMLLNINTEAYHRLLDDLKNSTIDPSFCCDLDSRVLHLEGFDAGIIIEQSQAHHDGPLKSQLGPAHPILALPYLSQSSDIGSMLAWVCWDEFVNLENPYAVKWLEKCNEKHIAALRIIMRSTLSQSVTTGKQRLDPSSLEIGYLMGALLMAAMSKLAARRTTAPVVSAEAGDTVTKLMRGLFGNLLTTAASGLRSLSRVWQLFALDVKYELPTTKIDWIWYEKIINLYPFTGWPLEQFHQNLERLLDNAIMQFVLKNEDTAALKSTRSDDLIKGCKLRNFQLKHYRMIITVLGRIFANTDIDVSAAANRGQRRYSDDLAAVRIYHSHSACYSELKGKVAKACKANEWAKMKGLCQEMMNKHAETAAIWQVKPESIDFQNMPLYKRLLNADFETSDDIVKGANLRLSRQVFGDAEIHRVPWQVGEKPQNSQNLEPLDDTFIEYLLTGSGPESYSVIASVDPECGMTTMLETKCKDEFVQFESLMRPSFIATMQKDILSVDVCHSIAIPEAAMRAFIKTLNPRFLWEDLGQSFQRMVLGLLKGRSSRTVYHPTRELLNLNGAKKIPQTEE